MEVAIGMGSFGRGFSPNDQWYHTNDDPPRRSLGPDHGACGNRPSGTETHPPALLMVRILALTHFAELVPLL